MGNPAFAQLTDDALFAEVTRRKAAGEDFRAQLGELTERWREPAYTVVRRVQGSFLRGSPDDQAEVFQEAVAKFLSRGLAQFRGVSEQVPGKAASPKTFFLRIVKHVAIDRYRRNREELEVEREDDEGPLESPAQTARAVEAAGRAEAKKEASEVYWRAFRRLEREHPNEAAAWDLYHHQDVEDHEECARLLDITVANSYKRVSRAQAWLKLYLLEEQEKEEAET